MSGVGHLFFMATLRSQTGEGWDFRARTLLGTDRSGQLMVLAQEGTLFQVNPGEMRTVRQIIFESGDEYAGQGAIAADGTVIFKLTFTDLSEGIFTAALGCPVDFNSDGGIDGSDVDAFFVAWAAGDQTADLNENGAVDGADTTEFFRRWSAGAC